MQFKIVKFVMLVIKKGKMVTSDDTELPNEKVIKSLEGESYKYLGVLEADEVMVRKMKDNVKKEYYGRTRSDGNWVR